MTDLEYKKIIKQREKHKDYVPFVSILVYWPIFLLVGLLLGLLYWLIGFLGVIFGAIAFLVLWGIGFFNDEDY